ncbi:MAG: rhodanese-like domain-containing protein [Gammaproteobacteria bacterium]|jgi:phage shock protein E|nr:rhodanese-like domain-containing protein [Gammaproteobacteria bacterium]
MTDARVLRLPAGQWRALLLLALIIAAVPLSFAGGHSGSASAAPEERPLVDPALLQAYLDGDSAIALIDTRSPAEYAAGHISGAVNIPFDDLENFSAALPADKTAPVVLYCRTGRRASILGEQLAERGYTSLHVLPAQQIQRTDDDMRILPQP